mmetsp:Transcript_15099/g.26431  ORF Transcript_15099/g.26431 Transcript_15099/m.26431 type:complete len:89 (+) Transcript_15099:1-267(+)
MKDLLPHTGPTWQLRAHTPGAVATRSKASALNLLSAFKQTQIPESHVHAGPGVAFLERLFGPWCMCEEVEVHSGTTVIVSAKGDAMPA